MNKIGIGEIFATLCFDFLAGFAIVSLFTAEEFSFQLLFFTIIFLFFGIMSTSGMIISIKENIEYKKNRR